jgi:hypothetical protein
VHENAESVGTDQVAVRRARIICEEMNRSKRAERANEREPAERAFLRGAQERVGDHDYDAEQAQNNLGREPVQVGELLGRNWDHGRARLTEIVLSAEFLCATGAITVRGAIVAADAEVAGEVGAGMGRAASCTRSI